MWHNHYGYHSYYITNAWVQMYMCQLSAGGSTIPWIIKTAPPHICLILKSFKLLEYQWRENVYLIKTDQKLPGAPPSVYDYGNLNDSSNWYGLDCTKKWSFDSIDYWKSGAVVSDDIAHISTSWPCTWLMKLSHCGCLRRFKKRFPPQSFLIAWA